jgi:hypothetical protein
MASEIGKNVPAPTGRGGSHPNPRSARTGGLSTTSQGSRPKERCVVEMLEKGAARFTIPWCLSVPRAHPVLSPGLTCRASSLMFSLRIGTALSPFTRHPSGVSGWPSHTTSVIPSNWRPVERVASRSAIPDILTRAPGIENRTAWWLIGRARSAAAGSLGRYFTPTSTRHCPGSRTSFTLRAAWRRIGSLTVSPTFTDHLSIANCGPRCLAALARRR